MASKEPNVCKFAFTEFTIVSDRKWSAKCSHCSEKIMETRGTSSGFNKHLERKHADIYDQYKKSRGKVSFMIDL